MSPGMSVNNKNKVRRLADAFYELNDKYGALLAQLHEKEDSEKFAKKLDDAYSKAMCEQLEYKTAG